MAAKTQWLLALLVFVQGARCSGRGLECPVTSTESHPVYTYQHHCYQFHMVELREFTVAQRECQALGGNEVIVRDGGVQRFLYDTIGRDFDYIQDPIVWIGLTDAQTEGTFLWVDGTPVAYTNWADGDEKFPQFKDCVGMDMNDGGRWQHLRCDDLLFLSDPHPYICEFALVHTGSTTRPSPSHTSTPAATSVTSSSAASGTESDDKEAD